MLRIELQSSRQVLPAGTLAHLDFNGDLSEQQGNFDTECHLGACNLSQSFAGQGQALTTAFSSRDDSAIRLTTRLPTNETELEEFSLSGWVYLQPESISYERQLISGTATDWFSLLISGGDSAGASRKLATYYGTNKSRTPIMLADVSYEKWTHFTVVMQRGEQNLLQVYIDGEHVNSVPAHTTRAFASKYDFSTMLVGRAAAGSERSIDGSLDDLMLHERALSQEEIRAMIGSEATGVYRSAPIQLAGPPTSVGLNLIGQNLEHVTVRLSTDRGANWCEFAENNSYLGTFRFEDAQRNFGSIDCYLPITLTNELLYEIEIAGPPAKISDVQIDELQLEIDYGIPACADGIDNDGDGFDGQADFGCQSHLDQAEEDTTGALELGINLAPVADWDTSLVWVDAFKSNRAWMTIADNVVSWGSTNLHRLALNENGYPTHLPQSVGGKQYKLHTLMLREIAGQYPSGEYRLHCAGNGEIELRFAASGQFNCPSPAAGYPVTVDGSSGAGVWLIMNRSSATNPIRRINFILPEYREPTSGQVLFNGRDFHSGNPNLPYFHPRFLEKLQGFHTIRFMDWQRTNNSELTHWSERRLISDASQAGPRVRSMPIVSISTQAPIAGALLGNHPLVRIETAIPHGLSSGQTVGFLKNNQEHTPRHRNYVHVIDATRFAMRRETLEKLFYLRTACNDGADNDNDGKKDYGSSQANDPGCDSVYDDSETSITQPVDRRVCRFDSNIVEVVPEGGTQSLSSISACVSGAETMFRLDPGVALEHQIDLINVLTASGWFHIPHLATKDYVEQFAQLIATRTDFSNPNTRIYLEYSNEAPWQGGFFSQGNWLSWKADSDPAFRALENKFDTARYYAYRTAQVFQWFETAFTAAGGDMGRVIRVLGGQAGSKWIGEQEFKHLAEFWSHTPESKVVDAYTIAGYCCGIGVDKSAIPFSQLIEQNLSPEALLDETFDRLDQRFHENETAYNEHAALAKEYGVTLLAYEGGQHLVPITEPHKSVESRNVLTKVWGAAQNDSRMYDMYTNNLRAWTDAGGGLFMHFSSFGKHSSWGMWGALEGVLQDDHQGPKYCFMRERLDGYGGEGSCHTRFAQPELGAPHCSNGIDDDGDGLVDSADPQCSNSQDVLESS